jgi:hypothetical protein
MNDKIWPNLIPVDDAQRCINTLLNPRTSYFSAKRLRVMHQCLMYKKNRTADGFVDLNLVEKSTVEKMKKFYNNRRRNMTSIRKDSILEDFDMIWEWADLQPLAEYRA